MKKNKFYVVWKGRKKGIFNSWEDCKQSINGFKGAEYKSFSNLKAAKKAFSESYSKFKVAPQPKTKLSKEQSLLIGEPDMKTLSVDAACSGNPGVMEYRGVHTQTKKVIFQMGPYQNSTNNIGEFLALVHALAYLKNKGSSIPIYSDSKIAIGWVKEKRIGTKLERDSKNKDSFELVDRALKWLHHNNYPNKIIKWETRVWGEIPADFGRK